MQYQSPIRLFEYCNTDIENPDFARLKKILTAEFSLSPSGIISIEGFHYSKNDIFHEMEKEDFLQRYAFHLSVWKEKSLLEYLEKNILSEKNPEWEKRGTDSEFVHFISPYFAESFDKVMRTLVSGSLSDAADWMRFLRFTDNPEDEEKALTGIRLFISESIRMLKNVNKVTYREILPQLKPWTEQPFYLFINSLPASLYKYTDELIRKLINFTVVIQQSNRKLCYQISSGLVKITNANPELTELIQSNHRIYKQNVQSFPPKNWKKIIKAVLLFSFFIFLITRNCGSPSSSEKKESKEYHRLFEMNSRFYLKTRDLLSVISTDSCASIINNNILIHFDALYYVMIENNDSIHLSSIALKNDTEFPIALYVPDSEGYPIDFGVDPGKQLSVEVNKPAFDIMFKLMGTNPKRPVMEDDIIPILISDSLDLSYRKVNLDNRERSVHIANPDGAPEYILHIQTLKGVPFTIFSVESKVRPIQWTIPSVRDIKSDTLKNVYHNNPT